MSPVFGGIGTFILNTFLNLNKLYKFEFLNIYNKPFLLNKLIIKNGGVVRYEPIKDNIFKYFTRYYYAKRFFKKYHDYSLVVLNTATINKIFWIRAAKKYGIKHFIIHSHANSSDKSYIYKKLVAPLVMFNKLRLSKDKHVIKVAASKSCGDWMFGNNSHFYVVSNGVNTNLFVHNRRERIIIRKKLGIDSNDKVIIVTSRLEYQKNYPKIISIFFYIHKHMPSSKLVIIGIGSELYRIKKLVKYYKLNDSVYFLGSKNITEIPKYLNIADMTLMPSFHEGMPFALIEAQAAGVPALVSNDISEKANITHNVIYLSLSLSSQLWSKYAINILNHPYDYKSKIKMNNLIKKSVFGLNQSLDKVKYLYLKSIRM